MRLSTLLQFALSVHYRQVASPAHVEEVHNIVHEHIANTPEINVKAGKKVSDIMTTSAVLVPSFCLPKRGNVHVGEQKKQGLSTT